MAARNVATEYCAGSSGESLRPWPGMSHTITVWSVARAGTVLANMWDEAANPCVSTTAGPDPVTCEWMCTPPSCPHPMFSGDLCPPSGHNCCQKRGRAARTAATWSARAAGVNVRSGARGGS